MNREKKILAFGASSSKHSINATFAAFTAHQLKQVEVTLANLYEIDLPVYSIDREKTSGIPEAATQFSRLIQATDGVVVSLAEHNGLFTAAFKNLWDWMSRGEAPMIWQGKPLFVLSTSPGKRPNKYVLKVAHDIFPAFEGNITATFYLPEFYRNFSEGNILDGELNQEFHTQLALFQTHLDTL
ncbi:MAG: NAD(P)H-dependent oxidoreductase [Bacteroidota bacterium]